MAYDRAERSLHFASTTGPNISPNTYEFRWQQCDCRAQYPVPFLTSARRRFMEPPPDSYHMPGPNAYYPKLYQHVPGGSSLRSTAKRVLEMGMPDAGGGKPEEDRKTRHKRLVGYMYHCSVPYTLLGYPPTIPMPNHRGYTIGKRGELIRVPPLDQDRTVGPARYRIRRLPKENFSCPYRGCHWSFSKSERFVSTAADGPGPGTYEIRTTFELPPPCAIQDPNKPPPRLLRYVDQVQETARRNGYPSPNAYSLRKPAYFSKGKNVQQFNSTADRFPKSVLEISPAPNQYGDPYSRPVKKTRSRVFSAFLTNARRFPCPSRQPMPAPNRYVLRTFLDELASKMSPYAIKNCAFDTSEERKVFVKTDTPAPNLYDIPKPYAPNYPSAAFASKSKPPPVSETTPSPASYNVMPYFNLLVNRRSHRRARRADFLSSTKRFTRVRDWPTKNPAEKIPASNEYNLRKRKEKVSSFFFSRARRFRSEPTPGPGPGVYCLSWPDYNNFNVTLGKPPIKISLLGRVRLRLKGCPLPREPRKAIRRASQQIEKERCPKMRTVNVGEGSGEDAIGHSKHSKKTQDRGKSGGAEEPEEATEKLGSDESDEINSNWAGRLFKAGGLKV